MVNLTNFIQKNFPKSIRDTYIHEQDVFEFIKKCDKNNWTIIGIEGLEYKDSYLKARLDMIADYSSAVGSKNRWSDFRILCNTSAKNFFVKILKPKHIENLIFDFTIYSEQDWSDSRATFLTSLRKAGKKWRSSKVSDKELFEIVREGIYGGFSTTLRRMVIPQERNELDKLFKELIDTLIE